jgi:hypothetical protein
LEAAVKKPRHAALVGRLGLPYAIIAWSDWGYANEPRFGDIRANAGVRFA